MGTRLHKNDHGIMKFERFERLSHQQVYNRCVVFRFKWKSLQSIFPLNLNYKQIRKKNNFSKLP